jgi:protein-glutamine gamma-glutamyltransferase
MNLDRALQLNTAALAVMGALFLGLGHESVTLPLILGLAAVVSVSLSNRFRWLRLNWLIANLMALSAVAWSMRSFLRAGMAEQLLAIADMLVYLQIVLLFQEKTARVYWQLIVLSLLQVVVAAALNLGPQFGLLLVAYMLMALLALALLCAYREWRKFHATSDISSAAAAAGNLLGTPVAASPQSAAGVADGARLPLMVRQVALLGLATGAFAGVFFYATPRHRDGAWSDLRGEGNSVSGLRNQVTLAQSGRIHLSSQLVMRVSLSSVTTGQPYPLIAEPYFHGMVLSEYVTDNSEGRWIVGHPPRPNATPLPLSPANQTVPAASLVRQDYLLEGGANQLFAILPIYSVDGSPSDMSVRQVSGRLVHNVPPDESRPLREYRYATGTSSLRNGRQLRGIPHRNRGLTPGDKVGLTNEREPLLRFDRERFAGLVEVADRAIRESGVEQASPLEQVQALERHFAEPGRYQYSLNLNFKRDPRLDPIEDFVVNHRTGHCEYFASALVMMLRSRNIPARILIGYRGGDFNTIGEYYQVRQRHAHAWVEALLPPGAVPEWELAGAPSGGGTWYRLDPTPPSLGTTAESDREGLVAQVMQTFDYAELLWRDYVLSLNAIKQRDSIYEPVSNRALNTLPVWSEHSGFGGRFRRLTRLIGMDADANSSRDSSRQRAIDWRAGVLTVVLTAAVIVAANAVYLVFVRWAPWRRRRASDTRRRRTLVPRFYRRLESLLARLPLRRLPGQTARELADRAAQRLDHARLDADRLLQPHIARLPREIVDAYYRVRFGGAALDSHEQAEIEHALAELTPAVGQAQR